MSSDTPQSITVMSGGPSAEREVSLRSGAAVSEALQSLGFQVERVDPLAPGWVLPETTEVVFLALHGSYGEDGGLQAELERLGLPYTGCDADASRTAFDKVLAKRRFQERGLSTPAFEVIESPETPWPESWEPPVVLKPARQGSSVGLQVVESKSDWSDRLREAFRYDGPVLMERKVSGREVTVGILDEAVLPLVEVRPKEGAYDYHHKYTKGTTDYLCPAPLPDQQARTLGELGLQAFRAIGGRDFARVDMVVPPSGPPVVLEVNTLPGLTEVSLFPMAAARAGIPFGELCRKMVELAWRRKGDR